MDFEAPQAFQQAMRKARKSHQCCECGQEIAPRSWYEYSSGIWEGRPDSFKTCTTCVEIRDEYSASTGEQTAFGELASMIAETFRKGFGPIEYAKDSGIALDKIMILFPDYYKEQVEE
jgi:hypothetical protein